MIDPVLTENDALLLDLEKTIRREYLKAEKAVKKKLRVYLQQFDEQAENERKRFENEEITEEEYRRKIVRMETGTKEWRKQSEEMAKEYYSAYLIAMGLLYTAMKRSFFSGSAYTTYKVERKSRLNTRYPYKNPDAIERILRLHPQLLPNPSKAIAEKIKRGEIIKWNQKKITAVVVRSIRKGYSIPKTAKALQEVTDMTYSQAVRNARTMMTSAMNGGRQYALDLLGRKGIKTSKIWLATHDGRTRHSHRMVDGEVVPYNMEFSNQCKFPADPMAPPEEIYNCRCTMEEYLDEMEIAYEARVNCPVYADGELTSYEDWINGG